MPSSNYFPLPNDPQITTNFRLPSQTSKSRLKFLILRIVLPITFIFILIGFFLNSFSSINSIKILDFKVCKDQNCLNWLNFNGLSQNWAIDFKSFNPNLIKTNKFKLNILHLIDQDTARVLMDRWLLHSHDAFLGRPDLISSAILWGPGFPDWINSLSLTHNIANRFGSSDHFDAVVVYFNNDQVKFLGIDPKPWFDEIKHLSQQGKGVVIIDRPHEMRDMRKAEFYTLANVSLILAPYPYELFEYRTQFATQALLVHQPHFIDKKVFYHPVTDPRPEEIIIAGDLGAFYPFRARLADMIRNKTLPGWIKGHPGYEDIKTPKQRKPNLTAEMQEQQLIDFGIDLGRAKICLVTDSRWGYSVQKYVEAAAAGCLIAGNVPLDRQQMFQKVIVPMSNKDSDQKVIQTLKWWLKHDQERISKAKAAQDWILNSFGMDAYVEDVCKWIWLVKDGQREGFNNSSIE
ncbi:hypothetical protein O181_116812 [Austropuccinia psidii MF-1]|uniref:Uncharacterized protein n=1 Tax=Austropuccinia psidii MF-1 TaxID=1389203 RepID=A0A9Q3KC66_9BASI|nr:hypothetical protein [Austropuccinia psidii MF-1]